MVTVISIPECVRQAAVSRVRVCGELWCGRGGGGGVALTGVTITSGSGDGGSHSALRYHRNTPTALLARTFLTLGASRELADCGVPLDNFPAL